MGKLCIHVVLGNNTCKSVAQLNTWQTENQEDSCSKPCGRFIL